METEAASVEETEAGSAAVTVVASEEEIGEIVATSATGVTGAAAEAAVVTTAEIEAPVVVETDTETESESQTPNYRLMEQIVN